MKKMIVNKVLMFFALAITSVALLSAPAYGCHKGGSDPKGCDPTPPSTVIEIGNFYFSPDPFPVDVDLSGPDVYVGWYDDKGNHDVTFVKMVMLPDGTMEHVVIAQLDLKPGQYGELNITAIVLELGLTAPGTYNVVYHCHQHETQEMDGTLTITVL